LPTAPAHNPPTNASAPTPVANPTPPTAPSPAAIITPDAAVSAKVIDYNSTGQFVVLNFPNAVLPMNSQVFFIYHDGLKTGEVKITGPERDDNVVADLVNGTVEIGDAVRSQ